MRVNVVVRLGRTSRPWRRNPAKCNCAALEREYSAQPQTDEILMFNAISEFTPQRHPVSIIASTFILVIKRGGKACRIAMFCGPFP
jgi:hypothetical protein